MNSQLWTVSVITVHCLGEHCLPLLHTDIIHGTKMMQPVVFKGELTRLTEWKLLVVI